MPSEPNLQVGQGTNPVIELEQHAENQRPNVHPFDPDDLAPDERAEDDEQNPEQVDQDDEVSGEFPTHTVRRDA